ncbi:exodeoxyribonuclease V subunit alpha [Marinobacter caseinilyticus]|uniref:exodeoxyribonuclease V subunit alpha n=1 Tax=Marinobacter caseinilyticus TaxID=2692195 RepID=UPI00140A0392|nr:exodeoxyribonuclease V subunit alpha [Marinobacter caseinilyticus]
MITSPESIAPFNAAEVLTSPTALFSLLEQWVTLGWLRPLDTALARFLDDETRVANQPASPLLLLLAALASHQLGRGHVCLDIAAMQHEGLNDALSLPPEDQTLAHSSLLPSDLLASTEPAVWEDVLTHPLLVANAADAGAAGNTPLVRDGLRLYLRRYWQYEQSIFKHLVQRLDQHEAVANANSETAQALKSTLDALFPQRASATDWQHIACANSARQGFSVITGGPGTGKTTTVVKLLAALQSVALSVGAGTRALRIRLAAPTGKAAARLNESISGATTGLDLSGLAHADVCRQAIPTEVTTLHRLLGSIPGSRRFRHDRDNPLVVDVLVIDEASMVDIEMMARVLDALPAKAKLILLGDKDQLASVDAGAVLGELCQRASEGHYTQCTAEWLSAISGCPVDPELVDDQGKPLDQAITLLRKSYRFDADSGIGQLAAAVNGSEVQPGSGATAVRSVFRADYADLARLGLNGREPEAAISHHSIDGGAELFPGRGQGRRVQGRDIVAPVGYAYYLAHMHEARPAALETMAAYDRWARSVLDAYSQFQLLCALRRGSFGVEGLNQVIAGALHRAKLIRAIDGWYPGRPVLVTRNDYSLGLMNGDIGICLELPARQWIKGEEVIDSARLVQRVAFPAGDGSGGIHWVLPSRLQAVETVYAMTVHKAQGSEFTHACLVLPDRPSPVLTRELIYTGITRAKHWFSLLLPNDGVFEQAVERQVTRTSGLGRLLLGTSAAEK